MWLSDITEITLSTVVKDGEKTWKHQFSTYIHVSELENHLQC